MKKAKKKRLNPNRHKKKFIRHAKVYSLYEFEIEFAKAKDKGIIRAFELLLNNDFLNSFTFVPIPTLSEDIRNKVPLIQIYKSRLIAFVKSSTC